MSVSLSLKRSQQQHQTAHVVESSPSLAIHMPDPCSIVVAVEAIIKGIFVAVEAIIKGTHKKTPAGGNLIYFMPNLFHGTCVFLTFGARVWLAYPFPSTIADPISKS